MFELSLSFLTVTEDTPSIPNLPGKAKGLAVGLRPTNKAFFHRRVGGIGKGECPLRSGENVSGGGRQKPRRKE
jgi:hypothetical protein